MQQIRHAEQKKKWSRQRGTDGEERGSVVAPATAKLD